MDKVSKQLHIYCIDCGLPIFAPKLTCDECEQKRKILQECENPIKSNVCYTIQFN